MYQDGYTYDHFQCLAELHCGSAQSVARIPVNPCLALVLAEQTHLL